MPEFFTDGDTPRSGDTQYRREQKMVSLLNSLNGAVGTVPAVASQNYSGSGSPEGVVPADVGATYVDTDAPGTLYFKRTGSGNTGWV